MEILFSPEEIQTLVHRVAEEVNLFYGERPRETPLLVIGVLRGGFFFLADLARELTFPIEIDFIQTSSYGNGMTAGTLELVSEPTTSVKGRSVLIVDDLIDSGASLDFLRRHLLEQGAADVEIAVLLDKTARRTVPIPCRFVGSEVQNLFLCGYGMDYQGRERNLPFISFIPSEKEE